MKINANRLLLVAFGCLGTLALTGAQEPPVAAGDTSLTLTSVSARPSADDDETTLEEGFIKKSSNGLRTVARGYKVCQDAQTGQQFIACGARPCPAGTTMIGWNPNNHPSCGNDDDGTGDACVDMKDLGWRSGHKTKFCKRHGYDGVVPKPGKYRKGGWCYSGDSSACG